MECPEFMINFFNPLVWNSFEEFDPSFWDNGVFNAIRADNGFLETINDNRIERPSVAVNVKLSFVMNNLSCLISSGNY